jgi:hypothetical protein
MKAPGFSRTLSTWATVAGFLVAVTVVPAQDAWAHGAPSRPSTHSLSSVHGIGVDLDPTDLLEGRGNQPTGTALADLMAQNGVQLVRLIWGDQNSKALAHGGWKTVFSRLAAEHINAILTLHMQVPGAYEGPGVKNDVITNLNDVVGTEEGVLSRIKGQWGGFYPANLVGLDVFNEPELTDSTVKTLRRLAATIGAYSRGIPVTIGGWRNGRGRAQGDFNSPSLAGLASTIGSFVSLHIYPDNMGSSLSTTNVTQIEPFATSFLTTAIAKIHEAGHSGIPILITETGGQNGQAPGGGYHKYVSGSPQHQAATLQAVVDAARQFEPKGVRGVLDWMMLPPPGEQCGGTALVCFGGTYLSRPLDFAGQPVLLNWVLSLESRLSTLRASECPAGDPYLGADRHFRKEIVLVPVGHSGTAVAGRIGRNVR